jgi:outer membrane protein OmpA-like peptidoglycan-associated protein
VSACPRPGALPLALALALCFFWGLQPAAAQTLQPDEPLPPGTKATILPLKASVLTLKPTILPLKATVLELRGFGTGVGGGPAALTARVEPLQAALKDLGATVKGREIKINLAADVLFDFDKSTLRPEAGPALGKVVAVLQSYPKAAVSIEGHTDGKGNEQYNQRLSEQRADSVRRWLVEHGVTTAMTTRGWGKTRPIAPNTKPGGGDDPEGRQKNRRVEITVNT